MLSQQGESQWGSKRGRAFKITYSRNDAVNMGSLTYSDELVGVIEFPAYFPSYLLKEKCLDKCEAKCSSAQQSDILRVAQSIQSVSFQQFCRRNRGSQMTPFIKVTMNF